MSPIRVSKASSNDASLTYECHCAYLGWQETKREGQTGGTTGQDRQMEAIRVFYDGPGIITVRANVDGLGWIAPVRSGDIAGTTGRGKALKALKIELKDAPCLHVEYCSHVSNEGWQDWVMDGQVSGCPNGRNHIEAIRIRLVYRTPERW